MKKSEDVQKEMSQNPMIADGCLTSFDLEMEVGILDELCSSQTSTVNASEAMEKLYHTWTGDEETLLQGIFIDSLLIIGPRRNWNMICNLYNISVERINAIYKISFASRTVDSLRKHHCCMFKARSNDLEMYEKYHNSWARSSNFLKVLQMSDFHSVSSIQ